MTRFLLLCLLTVCPLVPALAGDPPRWLGTGSWSPPGSGWPVLLDLRDLDPGSELLLVQERASLPYLTLGFQTADGVWLEDPVLYRLTGVLVPGAVTRLSLANLVETGRQALAQQQAVPGSAGLLRISLQPVGQNEQTGSLLTGVWNLAPGSEPPAGVDWAHWLLPWHGAWAKVPAVSGLHVLGYLSRTAAGSQELLLKTSDLRAGDELRRPEGGPVLKLEWVEAAGKKHLLVYQGAEANLPLFPPPGDGFWRLSLADPADQPLLLQLNRPTSPADFILR